MCTSGNGSPLAEPEGLERQMQHDDRVLAAREQQRRVAALGHHLAHDVDRFGFQPSRWSFWTCSRCSTLAATPASAMSFMMPMSFWRPRLFCSVLDVLLVQAAFLESGLPPPAAGAHVSPAWTARARLAADARVALACSALTGTLWRVR
jgi:hypothetical protein